MRRLRAGRLLLPLAAAAGAGISCSGGEKVIRPFRPEACALLWYRARPQGRFDLYKVELPATEWTTGSHDYDGNVRLGVFYYGLVDGDGDGRFEQYENAAAATSGSFALTVAGVEAGDAVAFQDGSPQSYLGVGDALVASGGTGGFDGVWSEPDVDGGGEEPVWAQGASLTLAYAGSSLTFGSDAYGAFGLCWR